MNVTRSADVSAPSLIGCRDKEELSLSWEVYLGFRSSPQSPTGRRRPQLSITELGPFLCQTCKSPAFLNRRAECQYIPRVLKEHLISHYFRLPIFPGIMVFAS
jgi:hypothetical protein